jgi:hypothetical protein
VTLGLLDVPWLIWGGICLVVTAIYTVVRPSPGQPAAVHAAWRRPVLRWAHALVWLVLAGSCFLRITDGSGSEAVANGMALLALPLYSIFLVALVTDRRARS